MIIQQINRLVNKYYLLKNKNKRIRKLEVGPGIMLLEDFETLDIKRRQGVIYVQDIQYPLLFEDNSFQLVYASHVLEHVPWYKIESTFSEIYRIIVSGGTFEVWVPDGLKICKMLVEYETKGCSNIYRDGWYRFNEEKNPYKWVSGRLYSYGDGTGNPCDPNWHKTLFTPKYLRQLLRKSGFVKITKLKNSHVRGYDHGWINLGFQGVKP